MTVGSTMAANSPWKGQFVIADLALQGALSLLESSHEADTAANKAARTRSSTRRP